MHPLRLLLLLAASAASLFAADPASSKNPLHDEARALFEAHRFPEAQAVIEKIAAAEPDNAEAQYYLGVLALRRQDIDAAIAHLERATALAPKSSPYMLELGGAYGQAAMKAGLLAKWGLAKKAKAALEQAVALDPENLAAHQGLLNYYQMAPSFAGGSMPKAYEQAEEIRRRNPAWGATALVPLYLKDQKFDDAFTVLDVALKANPDDYYLTYQIGRVADISGQRLERGEQALHRCLELSPKGNQPPHAAVHWRLGNLALKRGDVAAARAAYEKSLALDPKFKEATAALAKLNQAHPVAASH